MRQAFVDTLFALAKKNPNIILLTADLGFSVFEPFIEELPKQFINAGVSEQNMTGMAAGMAIEGKIPVIYSIVPFVTMRNLEQIRNDICYQNLNVKIIGVGAGFSYGPYGHTHHGLEDIGILRTLPNLTILSPGDPIETKILTKAALQTNKPTYIRLGRAGEPIVHENIPAFHIGKGIVIKEGTDIGILVTGTMVHTAKLVTEELEKRHINSQLASMPTIKPLDTKLIQRIAQETKALFTIEEHSIIGGLGSAVSEYLAENHYGKVFLRIGVPDKFSTVIGKREYMREANNLSVEQIVATIMKILP